jgi:hypothetical protein
VNEVYAGRSRSSRPHRRGTQQETAPKPWATLSPNPNAHQHDPSARRSGSTGNTSVTPPIAPPRAVGDFRSGN